MPFEYVLVGCPRIQEQEQWGKAFSASAAGHGVLALLLLIAPMKQKLMVQSVLTEINFVEKAVLVKEGPGGQAAVRAEEESGGEREEMHPGMKSARASSEKGSPNGDAITNAPMTGPIMSIDNVGLVGKKKAALLPFVGHTQGLKGKGLMSLPSDKGSTGQEIVLAKANLQEIRKAETSLGAPLISQSMAPGSLDRKIKLAGGVPLKTEKLKANPMDKESWGQKKGPFSMEGPLKYRKIVKMNLPPYPRSLEEQGVEASVSVRLWVDAKGRVRDNMYLEKASGYGELDYLAKDALSKFVFVPLPDDQAQDDEWGVATFRFELKR